MFGKYLIVAFAMLFASVRSEVEYDVAALCNVMPDGTKLGSIVSCQTYYTCEGGAPTKATCLGDLVFDKDSQQCAKTTCDLPELNSCADVEKGFVNNPSDCHAWIYCLNNTEVFGNVCGTGQIFQDGECIWGECTNIVNPDTPALPNICDVIPNGVFFGTVHECNEWQQCVRDVVTQGTCPDRSVFNVRTAQCVDNVGTVCERVGAGDAGGGNADTGSACTVGSVASTGDSVLCNTYYECVAKEDGATDGILTAMTCATGEYFDTVSGACKLRADAVPVATCNRCQYTTSRWVNMVNYECNTFLLCDPLTGATTGNASCADDFFFDETRQACIRVNDTNLAAYRTTNPVCNVSSS